MRKKTLILLTALVMTISFLCGFYLDLLKETSHFSILNHTYRFSLSSLLPKTFISFFVLLGVGILLSLFLSLYFRLPFLSSLSQDFLTSIPILFLALSPLTLSHYISAADLSSRLKLFALVILLAIAYLKTVRIFFWLKETPLSSTSFFSFFYELPLRKKLLLLFFISLLLYNAGSIALSMKGTYFSGDEPHYLLITHSLFHDGDFELRENYEREDYHRFLSSPHSIKPHAIRGAKDDTLYSSHSPGISFWLLPFYALGEFSGSRTLLALLVRFGMTLLGAFLGLQIFLLAHKIWQKENIALLLWFLFSFTSPVFFYSIHIYPEIAIALFSLLIFRLFHFSLRLSTAQIFLSSVLLSGFIWFHALKYLFILLPFCIYCFWVIIKKQRSTLNLASFLIPFLIIISLYIFFQYSLYGSLSPSSVSWRGPMTGEESLKFLKTIFWDIPFHLRWETLLGYFFDQRDGLLLYSPFYFFAFLGMVELIRRKVRSFLLLLALLAPYVLNSAFLTQRTGYAPQARPLVAVVWGLGIFVGHFLVENSRKIYSLLFSFSAFLSLLMVFLLLKNPLHLYQETTVGVTERGGGIFRWLSNLHFHLPDYLPSYIKVDNSRWLPNYLWLAGLVLFIALYLVIRRHSFSLKFSAHLIFVSFSLFFVFLWLILYPRMYLQNPTVVKYPSGEKITFYSLSRVAKMASPGKFFLPEDNRSYIFAFTSRQRLEKLVLDFGSLHGDYSLEIKIFDHLFFKEDTRREMKSFAYPSPPFYKLKNTYFYQVILALARKSDTRTVLYPYSFSLIPSI